MTEFYKSVLDQDRAPIVLCDLDHRIIYMNRSATEHYKRFGGSELMGKSLFGCHGKRSCEIIEKVIAWFSENSENNMIYTFRNDEENKDVYMVALRDSEGKLIGYYEKHEYRSREGAELYGFSSSLK